MSNYSTFHVPGIDAGVSLALDGDRLALCLMAKGRARNKDGSYSKRNPGRRALLLHLLERMQAPGAAHFSLTHSKGGASTSPWNEHQADEWNCDGNPGVGIAGTPDDMRKVYSKAGNFRVDYQFFVVYAIDLNDVAKVLGLEPADNRRPPRDVRFFGGA